MADHTMKAHDLLPVLRVGLTQGGSALDLTTAVSITFIMAESETYTEVVNSPAAFEDKAAGLVRYDWQAGDTDTPGEYVGEFEIEWPDDKPETGPTETYVTITIRRDLGNRA